MNIDLLLWLPLEQQMQHIEPLVSSPDVERELELYYRAGILLRPLHFLYGRLPDYDHMTDRCHNEQLKTTLFSMTSSEKALAAFLRILQGPQRSSPHLALRGVEVASLLHHPQLWQQRFGIRA